MSKRPVALGLLGRIRRFFRRCLPGWPASEAERTDIVTVSEVDYFGLANYLIDMHGPDARAQAARLMEDAIREQDSLAVADWAAVEQAIALLSRKAVDTVH
jgi:hypothetical protein